MQKPCGTGAKQRSMLEEMTKAGMQPVAASYNTLASRMMLEGKYREARAVLETEMPAAGVLPDDYTHLVFERSEEVWSKMRAQQLRDHLKEGTPEGRQTAHTFFEGLKNAGAANEYHRSLMLKHCDTSSFASWMLKL